VSTIVDLGALAAQGFIVAGDPAENLAGWSVASAGDFNRDGFADIILGAPGPDTDSVNVGQAYVVFGRAGGLGNVDLSNLQPAEGIIIRGASWHTYAGASVSGAGDINGDGFDDVVVAANYSGSFYYPATRNAYVIFGKATSSGAINLSDLPASPNTGFAIVGDAIAAETYGTLSVASAGDVNGDGFDDLILGSPYDNDGAGAAYLIFGKASGFGTVDLAILSPGAGFKISGEPGSYDFAGASVSGAGDVNGDGFDDIIVGARYGNNGGDYAGEAYVIFGKANGFTNIGLSELAPGAGFVIQGDAPGDVAGWSVSAAGDVNGDGFGDLIIGAVGAGGAEPLSGKAYVIFGKSGGFGTIDLSSLAPGAGFTIIGDDTADHAGWSVSRAGDVNGDGFDDIIVGAPESDRFEGENRIIDAGEAYVIFGKASGFETIDLTDLAPSDGFVIQGDGAYDLSGWSVAGAGDIDGDGFDDLLVSAPRNGRGGDDAGAVYIISGRLHFTSDVRNDFNGDGRSDVLWQHDNGTVREWLGHSPDGNFTGNLANVNFVGAAGSRMIGTGDFNGDGYADTLWQTADGRVTDLLGQAGGGFVDNYAKVSIFTGLDWHAIGTGDFNGDGLDDVLWQHDNGTIREWLGQDDGTFAGNIAHVNFVGAVGSRMIGAGDFNGDGYADTLWQTADGRVTDLLGQAGGGFVDNYAKVSVFTGLEWHAIGTGDFNGDGLDDVLWQHDNGTIREWLGQDDGTFAGNIANVNFIAAAGAQVIGIGDYDGDGFDDLLWSNAGTVTSSRGTSTGAFVDNSANVNIHTGTEWHAQDPFVLDLFA
jgi:hypothetical protein